MSRLKSELSWLRKKGVIKAGQQDSMTRSCGRCQSELGLILNRGAFCPSCRQRVCKQCREYVSPGTDWVCLVCRKQIEIRLATGEWMNEFIRRPSRRRGKGYDTPTQLIKKTLVKRSWTISSPSGVGREVENQLSPNHSPLKPPRRSTPTDENKPPWEYQLPEKPPRRYSMSSYDGLSTKGRCSRDTTSVSSSPIPNGNPRYSHYRPQNESPKYYFFGTEPRIETQRPSTLPRKPRHTASTSPENSADPARFHSIPRNRPRSESGQRGKSEPPRINATLGPLRENYVVGRYVSSGPVTSTPIVAANNSRGPPPQRYSTRPIQQEPQIPNSQVHEIPNSVIQSSLVNGKEKRRQSPRGISSDIRGGDRRREDEGGGRWMEERRRTITQSNPPLFDSGRSGSSRCLTPETSDEAEEQAKRTSSNRLPRSNTSISSGAATMGRQKKKAGHISAPVRRCRSFQAESSRPLVEKRQTSGQVARFVQELEKGIQFTVANMMYKKGSTLTVNESFNSSSLNLEASPSTSRSSSNTRRPSEIDKQHLNDLNILDCENHEKQPSQNSDNSSSDIVLDAKKITPCESDYKIVFISSDSSKESELNSSIDSDNPATPPRKRSAERSETDTTECCDSDSEEGKRLVKRRKSLKEKLEKRILVDAAVMTEEDFNTDDFNTDEGSDEDTVDDPSLSLSLRVPSPVGSNRERIIFGQPLVENRFVPPIKKDINSFPHPLNSLGPQELKAMLQQTETVQAEAQALKRALMGAFEPQAPHKRECLLAPNLTLPQNNRKSDNCHIGHSQQGSRVQNTLLEFPQKATLNTTILSPIQDKIGHTNSNSNIYENIEIAHQQHKTVCTQTDPEPFSGDSDTYETGDDSDISCDSLQDRENTPPPDLASFGDLPDKNATLHPTPGNMGSVRKETNQDVPVPPFYLSYPPPPFPCRIQPPSTHLRLTLNNPQHSVLLSSASESVHRLPRFGGLKSVHVAEVNSDRHVNKVLKYSDCVDQSVCVPKPSESEAYNRQQVHSKNERSYGGSPCILASPPSPSPLPLTNKTSAFRAIQSPSSDLFVPKKEPYLNHFGTAMNSSQEERKGKFSGQDEGDINASKKVICQEGEVLTCPSTTGGKLDGSSSSASEDDTDEDVHIFRSYDVSVDLNANKEHDSGDEMRVEAAFSQPSAAAPRAENSEKDSSTSESETDDEKHTTGEYAVTKVSSSDSEKENETCNLAETQENKHDFEFSREREEINEETETAELPECDQALSESAVKDSDISEQEIVNTGLPVNNCDISDISNTHSVNSENLVVDEISPEIVDNVGDVADEALECVAENKSETESNIGIDMDIHELSSNNNGEVLSDPNNELEKSNQRKTKEFAFDDVSSGDSDKEFARLERELFSENKEKEICHDQNIDEIDNISRTIDDVEPISPFDKIESPMEEYPPEDKITDEDLKQDESVCEVSSELGDDLSMDDNINIDQSELTKTKESPIENIINSDNSSDSEEIINIDKSELTKTTESAIENIINSDNSSDSEEIIKLSCLSNDEIDLESKVSEIYQTKATVLESSSINQKVTEMIEKDQFFTKSEEENTVADTLHQISNKERHSAITGSIEVEQENSSCSEQPVTLYSLFEPGVGSFSCENIEEKCVDVSNENSLDKLCILSDKECSNINIKRESSESGHSSNGESEKEDVEDTVKINATEEEAKGDGAPPHLAPPSLVAVESNILIKRYKQYNQHSDLFNTAICSPPVPIRRAKRSSSSDGLSSSSDIEKSDADASDSADTIIDGTRLRSLRKRAYFSDVEEDPNKDSDRPSSADSVLQGTESEYQCSDGSEEGNLISIVAVGEENPRKNSQGKIYIRSNSTDSDVQIKPTCIVVTGSSGIESGEDCENEQTKNGEDKEGNDVTILEVTSDHRKDHVMSVRVTSPESSRSTSPTRNRVSELQSMILTTRESQQQVRCSPVEVKESSSLANYFTVTLGTNSPLTPRRINKTPEVRRRKLKDRSDLSESSALATTPTPTLTPSPSHTPSPTLTPTPDHSEGDLLAYEENHGPVQEQFEREEFSEENIFDFYDEAGDNYEFSDIHEIHMDQDDIDITFDSIEDAESLGESNYSETSSEEGFEREDDIRGYAKRAYSFTLHTIIEESCEESDYEKRNQEEEGVKRDPSQLEKYFYFDLGNGPPDSKRFANEESEYSDTFSETSSSAFSEGMESIDQNCEEEVDPAELASSRLEKYFSGILNFERQPSIRSVGEESEIHTDESGSVGSDSEGSASPEQPRGKKFVKTRGVRSFSSNRSHGYSSDKGEGMASDGSHNSGEGDENDKTLVSGEDEISTESEEIAFEKSDGQFDTIKRRKKKKMMAEMTDKKMESEKTDPKHQPSEKEQETKKEASPKLFQEYEPYSKKLSNDEANIIEENFNVVTDIDISGKASQNKDIGNGGRDPASHKGPVRDGSGMLSDLAVRKYQSRDSGFIGSSDDLLKDKPEEQSSKDLETKERNSSDSSADEIDSKKVTNAEILTESLKEVVDPKNSDESAGNGKSESDKSSNDGKVSRSSTGSSVDLPAYSNTKGAQNLSRKDSFNNWSSDEETNIMMNKMRLFFKNMFSYTSRDAQRGQRLKSQLEARLTSLMRTVPGINDEQVKEMVDYLSSEDTWSDSNDSSDYTSSDLEGAYARLERATPELKTELQEQISASCQQIIKKFDPSKEMIDIETGHSIIGPRGFSGCSDNASANRDTAFVYQKVFSSLALMKPDSDRGSIGSGSQGTSPPLLAKVMHHIGNSLVALMHEVSAGSENGDDIDYFTGGQLATSSPRQKLFLPKKYKAIDSISFDSSLDKSSLTSNSFESEESPTDTEQSPESEIGTPKATRQHSYCLLSEKSSGEDFTSIESQRTVLGSHEYSRQHLRQESTKSSRSKSSSQRSLEERNVPLPQYFSYDSRSKDIEMKEIDDDKFDVREHHIGVPKLTKRNRMAETRKAKSQLNLEKIHQDEGKNTGERSESLGDLLDRVRSSDYSSSYEQLDSDSTLKASDSLDRHISSSSSNVRLNASSRGSLTTSSRGSLAASSRGSLNASSRGSLQGSSGPEEEDDKKMKKLSFLRYTRRSSVPDSVKDSPQELRSTTLPRSNPTQILATGTMPRSQPSQSHSTRSSTGLFTNLSSMSPSERQTGSNIGQPRSARYHAPGYRPPPPNFLSKRTISTPALRKDKFWHSTDESGASIDDGVGASVSASSASYGSLHRTTATPQRTTARGSAVTSPNSSRAASPFGESMKGSLGRTSANASATGSLASFDNSPDDDEARKFHDASGGRRSNLSALDPKSRSESLASVCSTGVEGRYGAVPVMGELRVGLQYNYKEGYLECHVLQCRDLAPVDAKRNRSDPYVKAYLLPDKSKNGKRKTKVKRHTLNPIFEETLKFTTPLTELESRTLWFSVWHSDMFGRNDFLGEIMIPLSDALFDDSAPRWYSLQDRMEPLEDIKYGAVVIIALKFIPPDVLAVSGTGGSSKRSKKSRGALQVRVKEANGLVGARSQSPPDPVCKGILLPERGKSSKQKTSVCRKTSSPKWNHTMTFDDVTMLELTHRSLELSVWDHDRFGGSEFLGGCRLNLGNDMQNSTSSEWMDASGLELKLWSQMLEKSNLWVESSILLRTAMDRPIYSLSFTE